MSSPYSSTSRASSAPPNFAPRAPQVYFTETSRKFQRRTIFLAAFESASTGRVLAFHPRNRSVEVLVDGLLMPNGIALEPNADANADSALIFSCDQVRLCRFDLRTRELTRFAELPGTVDNVRVHSRAALVSGGRADDAASELVYVVGLGSKYALPKSLLSLLRDKPRVRKALGALPYTLLVDMVPKIGMIAIVARDGALLETLQDPSASRISWLSEAEPWGGYLYLGSFQGDHIARVNASRLWPAAA